MIADNVLRPTSVLTDVGRRTLRTLPTSDERKIPVNFRDGLRMNNTARIDTTEEKFLTPSRVIVTLVFLAMLAAGAYVMLRPGSRPVEEAPNPNVTIKDFAVTLVDGSTINLSDFRGEVLVLDFWATWCPPCREEIPHLVKLAEDNRDKGLTIIGLTIEDPKTEGETVKEFIKEYGINYRVGYATEEMVQEYLGPGQQPIPQTLIFGRDGRLASHLVGFHPIQTAIKLQKAVNKELSAAKPG